MTDGQDRKSSDDRKLEEEIRQPRSFTPQEAIARMAGPGALKGASPVSQVQQAETEIGNWLTRHLAEAAPTIARNGAAIEGEHSGPNDRKLQCIERVREEQLHGLGAEAHAAMLRGEEAYGEMSLL